MPRAVDRSKAERVCNPPLGWFRTSSQRSSSTRGMPARTLRGRSARPPSWWAGGTADRDTPAHFPVSAAYSSAPRSTTSEDVRPGGRPHSAASTASPMIRTDPWWSTRTFSGASLPWATPTSCAAAATPAVSETSQAARRGPRGPSRASRMSSDVPAPHSLTT